jgi:hypothetical protein
VALSAPAGVPPHAAGVPRELGEDLSEVKSEIEQMKRTDDEED